MAEQLSQIGFGGGCHWCTEAVFSALPKISQVQQGYIKSTAPNDSYSEAVLLTYSKQSIPLDILIEIHLRTHASTSAHSMREKYRSAIYTNSVVLEKRCKIILKDLQPKFEKQLITQVLKHVEFQPSPDVYHNYYSSNPERLFCVTYIDPKLAMLKQEFAEFIS